MPFHWHRFNPGSYLGWNMPQCQNDENNHCSPQLSSLYQEIPEVHYIHQVLLVCSSVFNTEDYGSVAGMRRDTRILQLTSHHASVSRKVTMLSSDSAGN
ncbi:hypothetical protein LINPERPRIM_LOCUS34685 [Linum perenne]